MSDYIHYSIIAFIVFCAIIGPTTYFISKMIQKYQNRNSARSSQQSLQSAERTEAIVGRTTIRFFTEYEIDFNDGSPSTQVSTVYSREFQTTVRDDYLPSYCEVVIEDLPTYHEVMNGYRYDNNSGIVR